jgi:hypothetical protein
MFNQIEENNVALVDFDHSLLVNILTLNLNDFGLNWNQNILFQLIYRLLTN